MQIFTGQFCINEKTFFLGSDNLFPVFKNIFLLKNSFARNKYTYLLIYNFLTYN